MTQPDDVGPIFKHEIDAPNLSLAERVLLLLALNAAARGEYTWVGMTYTCQTDSKRRLPGKDYQALPGVSPDAFHGPIAVLRRVDNPANRRADVVGQVYMKCASVTREHPTNIRFEGITEFMVKFSEPQPAEAEAPAETVGA
jgi:hypothetical protein